jgi:hypothetical protein
LPGQGELFEEVAADKPFYIGELSPERGGKFFSMK